MQWLIDPARSTHAGVILVVGSAWLSNMSDPGGKCGLQDGCTMFFVDASRKATMDASRSSNSTYHPLVHLQDV